MSMRALFLVRIGAVALCGWLMADVAAAQFERVSVSTTGTEGNGYIDLAPAISRNGRFVVFASTSTNLVPNDTNDAADLFVRDRQAHTTTRIEMPYQVSGLGEMAIDDDGQVVAFSTRALILPGVANRCPANENGTVACENVYVHDRSTGTTVLASIGADGTTLPTRHSFRPRLSGDGRLVMFVSQADNLVPGDTNGGEDVFIYDRLAHTTTRVSVDSTGRPGQYPAYNGAISQDGKTVAFIADEVTFGHLPSVDRRNAAFVRNLVTGETRKLGRANAAARETNDVALNGDGTVVAQQYVVDQPLYFGWEIHDLRTGLVQDQSAFVGPFQDVRQLALSSSGRYVAFRAYGPGPRTRLSIVDRETGALALPQPSADLSFWSDPSFALDGRLVLFRSGSSTIVPNDTNNADDAFVLDLDPDDDGMPTAWETPFGLNPNDPADAGADPDHDGLTNLQEFQAHAHPTATMTRFFAEGAANGFFSTRVAVFNPSATANSVVVRMLGSNGQSTSQVQTIPANSRRTFSLTNAPDTVFSIVVEGSGSFVADRLMTWDQTGYGSHLETAITAPATTWHFAEGATGGPFSLYYLLQNPGAADAVATVNYLRPAPLPPITKTYTLAAQSRHTIDVTGEDPGLAAAEVSATITSDRPIVAERAMYFSTPTQPMAAGHDGAGIETPAMRWFLAEGATGFFDEFVLIENPQTEDAAVTVTYLLEDGTKFSENVAVAKQSRSTLEVKARDPRLLSTPVSIIVESTNGKAIVVERVMWWPQGGWYEASLSAGVTSTGTRWAIAEGEQGGASSQQTYVLVANTESLVGHATIRVFYENGTTDSRDLVLPANSRTSVDLGSFPAAAGQRFGITVTSDTQIVVERSLYSTVNGRLWDAGGTSVATNISTWP